MIISCIHIQSFGKINNLTLELDGGINIITGENESGKSTICNFIRFVFYGLPSKTVAVVVALVCQHFFFYAFNGGIVIPDQR